ncbi:MAG: FHA domain-containing protein [Anaerolineae bacterium]
MSQAGVCSTCRREIQARQSFCPHCGAPQLALLPSRTTMHIPDVSASTTNLPEKVVQLTRIYADIIVFQIAGYEQPVLVKPNQGQITIGRYSPGEMAPSLDLNPFNGSVLGVSRQHATIIKNDDGYSIRDLGSTNGTWLNDERLVPHKVYPLKSGDTLRAAQIAFNVNFRLPMVTDNSGNPLILKNEFEGRAPVRLTLGTFQSVLLPFLNAMILLQTIVSELSGLPQSETVISSISIDTNKSAITIDMTAAAQAIRLLTTKIARWQEQHAEVLRELYLTSHSKSSTDLVSKSLILGKSLLNEQIDELTKEVLRDLLNQKATNQLNINYASLSNCIETLAISPLRVSLEN